VDALHIALPNALPYNSFRLFLIFFLSSTTNLAISIQTLTSFWQAMTSHKSIILLARLTVNLTCD